jgi:hypothetical protein
VLFKYLKISNLKMVSTEMDMVGVSIELS